MEIYVGVRLIKFEARDVLDAKYRGGKDCESRGGYVDY